MKFKKVYVTMIVKILKDGSIRPLSMVWEDGATYDIDRVLYVTPAASLKVGGCGKRYTVMIEMFPCFRQGYCERRRFWLIVLRISLFKSCLCWWS